MRADGPVIVVLTTGSAYGVDVVRRLAARGVPCIVALQSMAALRECFRTSGWRRVFEVPVAIARAAWRGHHTRSRRAAMSPLNPRITVVGRLNTPRMVAALRRMAPDVLIVAGSGIVDDAVLAVPRWGALNGHPGLLPWVRGNGVVAHALARGVALGASVHHVDPGIDTGAVVACRLLPVTAHASLRSLERDSVVLAAELLAEVTARVAVERALPAGTPQSDRHPLCRWMEAERRREVEAEVEDGLAHRLFERWRAACEPVAPPWTFPAHGGHPAAQSVGPAS